MLNDDVTCCVGDCYVGIHALSGTTVVDYGGFGEEGVHVVIGEHVCYELLHLGKVAPTFLALVISHGGKGIFNRMLVGFPRRVMVEFPAAHHG